jgi:hypothetical protein
MKNTSGNIYIYIYSTEFHNLLHKCYVGHCPRYEVYLMDISFWKLALLSSSDDGHFFIMTIEYDPSKLTGMKLFYVKQ